MKRLVACGLVALNLFVLSCSDDELDIVNNEVSYTITQQILELTNLHRTSIGKTELARSEEADELAVEHTLYMIEQGSINHDNFIKRLEILRDQVNADAAGENVAYGYATGETVMEGWLNSAGHKANIEGNYTHVGIAAVKADNDRYYYMQLFYR